MARDSSNPGAGADRQNAPRTNGAVRTARRFQVEATPAEMSAGQIADLRRRQLRVSQRLFADLLNVSLHTVHSWEQGNRRPSGCALRLLHMAQENPGKLIAMVRQAEETP